MHCLKSIPVATKTSWSPGQEHGLGHANLVTTTWQEKKQRWVPSAKWQNDLICNDFVITQMLHVWDIYLHLGDFLGQMLVNIPYMEHLGYNPLSEPSDFLCISLWSRPLSSSSRNNVAVDPVPFATWTAYDWGVAAIYIYMYYIYIYRIVPPYTNSHQNPVYIYI